MNDLAKRIGKRLRQARESRGLTQVELAAQIGVTQKLISRIEGGHRAGSVQTLLAAADTLNLSMDDLLGRARGEAPRGPTIDALLRAAAKCSDRDLKLLVRMAIEISQRSPS